MSADPLADKLLRHFEEKEENAKLDISMADFQNEIIPMPTAKHNTGPKGVLEDFKRQQREEYQQKILLQRQQIETAKKKAMLLDNPDCYKEQQKEDELSDEEFLKQYKQKRIQEILDNRKRQELNRPRFGTMREIREVNFVKEIEQEQPNVHVLIHFDNPYMMECQLLNVYLNELALKYGYAKFLKIQNQNFEDLVLPTILVYKNGELIVNLVKFLDYLEQKESHSKYIGGMASNLPFSLKSVENALLKTGALTEADVLDLQVSQVLQEESDSEYEE